MEVVKQEKPTILVIDDDDQIRRLLLEIFDDRYDCWEVGSAEEALLALARQNFDLVISDINMGGMTIRDFLREQPSLVPVFSWTFE